MRRTCPHCRRQLPALTANDIRSLSDEDVELLKRLISERSEVGRFHLTVDEDGTERVTFTVQRDA